MKQVLSVRLLALCSCAILIGACGETNAKKKGFTLTGSINGIQAGSIKLVKHNREKRTSATFDSVEIKQGKFIFEGELPVPEMMNVVIEPGGWGFEVFVENSNISVTADTTGAQHYDWTAYGGSKGASIVKYAVEGSESNNQWMSYQDDPALKKFEPVFAELNKEYQATEDKDKQYAIKEKLDSIGDVYAALQKKWIDSFIVANPSSAAGSYMLSNYYMFHQDLPIEDMERLVSTFSGPAKSTVYFQSLSDELGQRQALQPGKIAPDFTLLKRDSSSFTLSSLRGKYVLLDFWASWCVPCRKAIPHWKEVYSKYHDKGLEIVGVTNDSRWKDWFKALDEEKMPWLQVADEFPEKNMPSRVGTLYMTPYLPTYILLDKEGKVVLHNASKEQIDNKLKEVL